MALREGLTRMNIQGRVAIITGASSGIGAATARELARQGAKVVLAARRTDHLNMLVEEIVREGGCALAVPTDVRERGNIDHLVQTAAETFGRIDLLINNAGVGGGSSISDRDETMQQLVAVNLLAPTHLVQAALPCMRRQGSGMIINIGSVVGEIGMRLQGANARTGSRGPNYRQSNSASSAYNHCAMALQATDLWSEAVSRGHRPASWQCDNATAREQIWK